MQLVCNYFIEYSNEQIIILSMHFLIYCSRFSQQQFISNVKMQEAQ